MSVLMYVIVWIVISKFLYWLLIKFFLLAGFMKNPTKQKKKIKSYLNKKGWLAIYYIKILLLPLQ